MRPRTEEFQTLNTRRAILALLFLLAFSGSAFGEPVTPRLEGRVTDLAAILSVAQRQHLCLVALSRGRGRLVLLRAAA